MAWNEYFRVRQESTESDLPLGSRGQEMTPGKSQSGGEQRGLGQAKRSTGSGSEVAETEKKAEAHVKSLDLC